MYYLYILQSRKDEGLYIGYTKDLKKRLTEHNAQRNKSTSRRAPLNLIYYEAYINKDDAKGREKFLKSGLGRHYLKKQLRNYFSPHPTA